MNCVRVEGRKEGLPEKEMLSGITKDRFHHVIMWGDGELIWKRSLHTIYAHVRVGTKPASLHGSATRLATTQL